MTNGFKGRVALVTGAAGGIGEAVVRQLLAEGARVVAADLHPVGARHADFRPAALDVTDAAAVERLVDEVERDFGAIDFGVSVAGILSTDNVFDTSDETWRRVFAVNADGVFHFGRAVGRRMKERRRGAIVTVSSNAGGVPRQNMAAYAASKAAATMFTRCLGLELAPHGVRCNIVAPGSTRTAMLESMWQDEADAAALIAGQPERFKAGIPLGKLAAPDDVAAAVLFLLSAKANHITMADLYVDGGATLRA